jgi:hypothetical protein
MENTRGHGIPRLMKFSRDSALGDLDRLRIAGVLGAVGADGNNVLGNLYCHYEQLE